MRFNPKLFSALRKSYEEFDGQREEMIKQARVVIKISKQLIYAVHREDFKSADEKLKSIKEEFDKLRTISKDPRLRFSGTFRSAAQEFVEAVCFYELSSSRGKGSLPSPSSLKVDFEEYLLGTCDLVGELGRAAVHATVKGDIQRLSEIKDFVEKIYNSLLEFDFRNGDLRRKFDSVKYTLAKLEDIKLGVALKGRTKE